MAQGGAQMSRLWKLVCRYLCGWVVRVVNDRSLGGFHGEGNETGDLSF